jgi:hypothetical protein
MPRVSENSTGAEPADLSDPRRNFLDLDPAIMLDHHWPEMQSRRPRYEFFYDPRLRTYARALQVICIELEAPGTLDWTSCEPVSSLNVQGLTPDSQLPPPREDPV